MSRSIAQNVSEEELLRQVLGGSRSALDSLYERTRARLLTTLFHLSGDVHAAEDVMHETYLRLWERRHRIEVEQSTMAYLMAIARHLWFNERERRATFRRIASTLSEKGPWNGDADQSERWRIVARAIADLPADPREVFTLHRHAGLTYAQIAALLGISVKTVEARMTRAFDGLRASLRPHCEEMKHDVR